ncbi:tryptophan synthase subunit alpha [Candidatus Harpocratesius sp.]
MITNAFNKLEKLNECAFIPFLTLGDPNPELFMKIIQKIAQFSDILELGIPFSDPLADGPTIQSSNKRCLNNQYSFDKSLELLKKVKNMTKKPIVVLTYANVIGIDEIMERNLKDFKNNGVDGIIIADIPLEESEEIQRICKKTELDLIQLISPTTSPERIKKIAGISSGFLYIVSLKGTTGVRENINQESKKLVKSVKFQLESIKKRIPICIGFGISNPSHVKEICEAEVDGVIVGSAIIDIIAKNLKKPEKILLEIENFVFSLKKATKTVKKR